MRIRGKVKGLALVMALLMALNLVGYATAASTAVGSFDELKTAISNGNQSILLTADVTIGGSAVNPFTVADKTVVIDLGGNTLYIESDKLFAISGTSDVTIKNGIVSSDETTVFSISDSATLCLENVDVTAEGSVFYTSGTPAVKLNGATVVFGVSIFTDDSDVKTIVDGNGDDVDFNNLISNNTLSVPLVQTSGASNPSYSTQIKVTVTGTYSISVPATIDFGTLTYDDSANSVVTKTGTITLEHLVTAGDETVTVSVKGNGAEDAFVLKSGDRSIEYTVLDANSQTVDKGKTVATFTNPGEADFSVQLDKSNLRYSGDYTGSLIFTVNISE